MKKRYIVLIAVSVAVLGLLVIPIAVSAASGGDAFDGLKEFYTLLYNLANLGYQGYVSFLGSF